MFEKKVKEKVEKAKEEIKPVAKNYAITAGLIFGVGILTYKLGYHEGLKTGLLVNGR